MFQYELSTTGAISFVDLCLDLTAGGIHTRHLAEATEARANLRSALKENKRTGDEERDFLGLVKVLEEYLPHLIAIINCVSHDELALKTDSVFSWRTSLSANVFNTSPRLDVPRLQSDYAFSLLAYSFALSNLARTIVVSLGAYEHERAITDLERKAKDEKLKHALDFLCRASGIFSFIADHVLLEWEKSKETCPQNFSRPPELTREVNAALAKLALADAQSLAIRKLLSKSVYDSNITPGPPLPKSHPSPALLAKLHLENASMYSSARSLVKTCEKGGGVSADLRHYLADEAAYHDALGKKWLGIEAGENGKGQKTGDAIGLLIWARKELDELKDGGKGAGFAKGEKEKLGRNYRKAKVAEELTNINVWLNHYKKMNDTVHFQQTPAQSDLQSRIPTGTLVFPAKAYMPPTPAFGPGSVEYIARKSEEVELDGEDAPKSSMGTYAGAQSYF